MRFCYLFLIYMSTLSFAFSQPIIRVTPSGAGDRSGSSWANALSGTALAGSVVTATPGIQFWVAAGTYYPTITTDRTASFSIASGVQVYGGFGGSEAALSERIEGATETVFSGDIGVQADISDNSNNVIIFKNVVSTTKLNSIIIEYGNGERANFLGSWGGGIFNYAISQSSDPEISFCTIRYNRGIFGGGIGNYAEYSGSGNVTLKNCLIYDNDAEGGGGIFNFSAFYATVKINILNCELKNNVATTTDIFFGLGGGAILNLANGQAAMDIINTSFQSNRGLYGGAIFNRELYGKSEISIENSFFKLNQAKEKGGIIYSLIENYGQTNSKIINSVFIENTANSGAILAFNSDRLTDEAFGNSYNVSNCTFVDNYSSKENSIIDGIENTNKYFSNGILSVKNSIIYCIKATSKNLFNPSGFLKVSYSNIQGNYPGTGNIDADPKFINPSTGNFYLQPNSPAINAGDPDTAGLLPTDLAGQPRVQNGRVDMGAYESACLPMDCVPISVQRKQ